MEVLDVSEAVTQALKESGYSVTEFKLTPVQNAKSTWYIDFDETVGVSKNFWIQIKTGDTLEMLKDQVKDKLERLKLSN